MTVIAVIDAVADRTETRNVEPDLRAEGNGTNWLRGWSMMIASAAKRLMAMPSDRVVVPSSMRSCIRHAVEPVSELLPTPMMTPR